MTDRRLYLMRHAKSSWDGNLADHDRPLNRRGQRDAPRMARALAERAWLPAHVFLSDAERTTETLLWMNDTLEQPLPSTAFSSLYLGSPGQIMRVVEAAPAELSSIMILAHNPGCEEVIEWLTGAQVSFTTANVARLRPPTGDWQAAAHRKGQWELEALLRPKD